MVKYNAKYPTIVDSLKIKSVMSSPVETVKGNQSIRVASQLMERKQIGSLLVLRENSQNGIVTERDIVHAVANGDEDQPVEKYQNSPIVTINENSPLGDAAQVMLSKKIRRLIVTDNDGKISGIINIRDITYQVHEKFLAIFDI